MEACAQTDAVAPLSGAISLSNPFETKAIEVVWAYATCDASITFTFSLQTTGYELIGDRPDDCPRTDPPLPVYIRFRAPMPADTVHADLSHVTARDLYTPIDSVSLSDNRRQIRVQFAGPKEYVEGDRCSAEYAAETSVTEGVLGVGVFISFTGTTAYPPSRVSIGCDAIGYNRSLDWDLVQPFPGSGWRDLRGGGVHAFGEAP